MLSWSAILLVLYALGVLSLAWNVVQTFRLVCQQPTFDHANSDDDELPSLVVVIPVKDEEASIAACIHSVLTQDYPNLRLIVVNDRSTDGTPRVLDELARADSRLHRLDVTALPAGRFGKPNALASAAPLLTADLVAFVDSDFELGPNCLRAAVQHQHREGLDWCALMGAPDLRHFWEKLLVPLFGAMAYAWYDPRAISDPEKPDAIGSGFILTTRRAYFEIGGHEAVASDYDEDSALIRLAKRAGHKVAYLLTPDLFSVRFYGGLKKTLHGMTRTCIGGIKTLPRMFITLNALNFVSLLPLQVLVAIGVLTLMNLHVPWRSAWIGLALGHLALSTLLCGLIYDRARVVRWYAMLHPLGACFALWVCLRAARGMIRRGPITWRGTTY